MNIREETLKIARNLIKKDPSLTDWVISKFPELQESGDERIRKHLINYVKNAGVGLSLFDSVNTRESILTWLEKQGEKESVTCPICGWEVEKQGEQKPTDKIQLGKKYKCIASPRYSTFTTGEIYKPEDKFLCNLMNLCSDCFEPIEDGEQKLDNKVEPKFKDGDWIVYKDTVWKVCNISLLNYYELLKINNEVSTRRIEDVDKNARLWTIQDAKDGDVLVKDIYPDGMSICLFKEFNPQLFTMKLYCSVDRKGQFLHNHCAYYHRYDVTLCPATKEQRETLMKAMTDAGYTFDFEKKELKKIEAEELTEQKHSGWSDYDECMLTNLIDDSNCSIDSEYAHWLKSFKDRVQPQREWNEEDNRMRKAIIDNIKAICEEGYFVGDIGSDELINWLEDRVQSKQKWSKRDIHIITNIYDFVAENIIDINRRACANECLDWIKSLKYGFKPVLGWSEEDKETLDGVIDSLRRYNYNVPSMAVDKQILWLKSIKNRIDCEGTTIKKWKPSEKQLKELENVFNPDTDSWDENILRELYKQLKQL